MRIGIVSSTVPHVDGGYRKFVDDLAPELEKAGHSVERIWLPFSGDPETMFGEMIAFRMMDLNAVCDMVVCCRPPAHVIRHKRKVVWFIHHERVFYDLWETEYNTLKKNAYWHSFRKNLMLADSNSLAEAHRVFSNSQVVADRLRNFNGIEAEVLYPPLGGDADFTVGEHSGELLFVCRIEHHKRQHLAVEAMARTRSPVRMRIVGASSNPGYVEALQRQVRQFCLEDRVTIDPRWISEGEKRHLLSQALGVVYVPVDEDSYGYPVLEAAHAARPVVSTRDAGGVGEFVEDGRSGLMVDPAADALASAFDQLWCDRAKARKLGEGARDRLRVLHIDWDHVVESLTA